MKNANSQISQVNLVHKTKANYLYKKKTKKRIQIFGANYFNIKIPKQEI